MASPIPPGQFVRPPLFRAPVPPAQAFNAPAAIRPPGPLSPGGFPAPQQPLIRAPGTYNAGIMAPILPPEIESLATVEEMGSVLLFPEEIPVGSKRLFAKKLFQSFRPCQTFMSLLLRFPIVSFENDDRTMEFAYNWHSLVGFLYFVTSAIIGLLTVSSCISIVSTMLNFPKQPDNITVTWNIGVTPNGQTIWETLLTRIRKYPEVAVYNSSLTMTKDTKRLRAEEMYYFRRNLAPLMMTIFLLLHIITADWNLFQRRHFIASYLTFWTESVEIMQMDAAGDAVTFFKKIRCYYFCWFFVYCGALLLNFAPVASGAPVSFAMLWVRYFWPSIHTVEDSKIRIMRISGGVIYLYVVVSSKVYVFFFLYICKLLANACTVWNGRLEIVFTARERAKSRQEKCASRTGYDHLFKDYVNLLDLQEGADTLFTNIIESYFSMTIMSIVFEVYYLARPIYGSSAEFVGARDFDMCLVAIYLFNSVVVLYLVSTGAAEVGAAFSEGLEIIRKQGILGHRSDPEMHLMISLYMSYTGHFDTALQGGGYFILDKPFFVSIAGTMISYIIIIFQFQPALGLANEEQKLLLGIDNDNPYDRKVLLMHVENTFQYDPEAEPFY